MGAEIAKKLSGVAKKASPSTPAPPPSAPEPLDAKAIQELLGAALGKLAEVKDDPTRFRVYEKDPLGFASDILGITVWGELDPDRPGLTPDQVTLLEVLAFGKRRIACRAGHGVGKSFVLAIAVLWWLYCKRGLVITTASTWEQTERVLWREIATRHAAARVPLPGQLLQVELRLAPDWYAVGLNTKEPGAFRGRHHKTLLVIMDEAPAIADEIHDEAISLCTGESNTLVMVGNPIDSQGAFYLAFIKGPWYRLHFNCLNHPNVRLGREVIPGAVTKGWVEEQAEKYGIDSPLYASRVLGEFPAAGTFAVIPVGYIDKAMEKSRYRAQVEALDKRIKGRDWVAPVTLACDVARFGHNRNVLMVGRGRVITEIEYWSGVDATVTTGLIIQAWRRTEAQAVIVDEVGLGGPIIDRLLEQGVPIVGFHSGRSASDRALYLNRRAEGWFFLRRLLEAGEVYLPDNEDLRSDLLIPRYSISSAGKISLVSKKSGDSPDFGDTLMMFMYGMPEELEPAGASPVDFTNKDPRDLLSSFSSRDPRRDILAGF